VEEFVSKHADAVIGVLSGFDRLVFRGTLRMLAHRSGVLAYLWAVRVRMPQWGGIACARESLTPAPAGAGLHRRTEVSQAANDRYANALAAVEDTRSVGDLASKLCLPVKRNGRQARALNPYAPDDTKLLQAISRGEFTINGFRNRDLRGLLFADDSASKPEQRRHAVAVSRRLALLRAHRMINKVPGTHRYQLSTQGRSIVTALIAAQNTNANTLTKLAA
jgi:hypothetical protein